MPTISASTFVELLSQQAMEMGDKISMSLEFSETEDFLQVGDIMNRPEWLSEEVVMPIFQGYLERFQNSGAPSFKSSTLNDGYRFGFEVKEQLATLTIIKETDEMSPKASKKGETRPRYGADIKDTVIESLKNGLTAKDAADKHGVSMATVNLWKKAAGLTGGKRGRKPSNGAPKPAKAPRSSRSMDSESDDSITLNGVVYVRAKPNDNKSKAELLKTIEKLQTQMNNLRDIVDNWA